MPDKSLTLYTHPDGLRHDTGPGHPERADRLRVVLDLLNEKPFSALPVVEAPQAAMDRLRLAHPQDYIDHVREMLPEDGHEYLDPDTVISPGSWDAALRAAGAVCRAVDDVAAGKTARAFCAVRPPGHHALADRAMGFCIFANIFIGARHAQEKHGLKKIAIVDFDVHHGNGTDALCRAADNIFLISSQQMPFYPGTGDPKDDIPGRDLNIPFAAGAGSAAFRRAYEEKAFPALEAFAPDLLMISAGFDAHRDDPVGGMDLTEEDYAWVTSELRRIADKYAGGRIVSALEGGYDLDALKNSVAAHLRALS